MTFVAAQAVAKTSHYSVWVGGLRGCIAAVSLPDMIVLNYWTAHRRADVNSILDVGRTKRIWTAGADCSIEIWDAELIASIQMSEIEDMSSPRAYQPSHRLQKHRGPVTDLQCCNDQRNVVSVSVDRSVVVWDALTLESLQTIEGNLFAPFLSHEDDIRFVRGTRLGSIWVGSCDRKISVWEPCREAMAASTTGTASFITSKIAAHEQLNRARFSSAIEAKRKSSTEPSPMRARSATPQVIKGGWMIKQGGSVKNWKRRYFQLYTDRTLKYFVDEECQKLKGTIPIFESSDIHLAAADGRGECVHVTFPHRVYIFLHETNDTVTFQWYALLASMLEESPEAHLSNK